MLMLQQASIDIEKFAMVRKTIRDSKPLIHCITNPISINDCANVVLATGAKPIMAEHPREVAGITGMAKALAVNLGNITDARMESILISGVEATKKNIPAIIDVVGVTCSDLRLSLAQEFIQKCRPAVIKGNISEIKALSGITTDAVGLDASDQDLFSMENIKSLLQVIEIVKSLSNKTGAVVLASGKVDTISDGKCTYLIENGCEMLSSITGTGCMLNVLTGAFLSTTDPIDAAVYATAMMGISGELAETDQGCGTFRCRLLDTINTIHQEELSKRIKLKSVVDEVK